MIPLLAYTSRNRRVAYTASLLALLLFAVSAVPQSALSKVSVTVSPKSPQVTDEVKLSLSGLKHKRTYTINIVASKDSFFDCGGGGGTYENGQLTKYTRVKSTSKGKVSTKLTPARALGTNWCKSTYKGTVKLVADKSKVASFSFKAKS